MIKPDTLWNLFKNCKSPLTLGRICFGLANRRGELDSDLNDYEETLVAMIKESEEWMDEAIDTVKGKKRYYYLAKKHKSGSITKDELDELDKLDSKMSKSSKLNLDTPPSVRPSIHPSKNKECVTIPAHTREEDCTPGYSTSQKAPPTWDDVKKVITSPSVAIRIPEEFAKIWYSECEFNGWLDVNKRSIAGCWRNKLLYAWRDAESNQRKRNGGKTDAEVAMDVAAQEAWNRKTLTEECDD